MLNILKEVVLYRYDDLFIILLRLNFFMRMFWVFLPPPHPPRPPSILAGKIPWS